MRELAATVRRAGGAPVADYQLIVDGPKPRRTRVRNADGAYEVRRLPPGKYKVTARNDAGSARAELEPAPPAKERRDLNLVGWASATGTVVDGKTGKPWSGLMYMV